MLNSHFKIVFNQIVDGVKIKVLHRDDSMIMTEFMIKKGALLPEHVHQSDHSAYLLQGKIRMTANEITSEFIKGDSWCMKKNISHFTEAVEDSVVLEVFSHDGDIEGFPLKQNATNRFRI
jgi:quercetin dioxygenase-like cupin family protein